MSRETATYLYCLVRDRERPDVQGAPAGVPGASAPRLLPLETGGGLWLVVADAPLPAYGEEEIGRRLEDLSWVSDRALAHEAVVEHFAAAAALIPMKLFTLFDRDERALEQLRGELPLLLPALDRVAGRSEWGVRLRHDRAAALAAAEAESGGAARAASGKDFLLRKRAVRDATRQAPSAAREVAEQVYEDLAGRAAESHRREPEAGTPLVLDAAFLVDRVDRECFVAAVEAAGRSAAEAGCELTLTGPWPPYNFVDLEQEPA